MSWNKLYRRIPEYVKHNDRKGTYSNNYSYFTSDDPFHSSMWRSSSIQEEKSNIKNFKFICDDLVKMLIPNGYKIICEKIIIDSKKDEIEDDENDINQEEIDIREKNNTYEYHPNGDVKNVKHIKKRPESHKNNIKIEGRSNWWDPGI